MPRSHLFHINNTIQHLTHRCRDHERLLKFSIDRDSWVDWLFRARRRHRLTVLNYLVTQSHTHLLIYHGESRDQVNKAMQLIGGRVGREYNRRKKHHGPFWEDRNHSTIIEPGATLLKCLAYIDLNMVRKGEVKHPREWEHSGFHEIQQPRQRYRIIDREKLAQLLGLASVEELPAVHARAVEDALQGWGLREDPQWSETIAAGSDAFVARIREELGPRARHRQVIHGEGKTVLRQPAAPAYEVTRKRLQRKPANPPGIIDGFIVPRQPVPGPSTDAAS